MALQIRLLVLLSTLICLASVVLAKEGTSSVFHYRPSVASSCYRSRNQGNMIAGANPTFFDGGEVCGRRYRVRCLGGTNNAANPCRRGEVIVTIVDLCNECGAEEINLSQDAFARIANPRAGRVRVDYTQV